jgi:hypothetical protein
LSFKLTAKGQKLIAKGEERKGKDGEDIQYCEGEQEAQIPGPAA